jgi:spermidine synthase
MVEKKLRQIPSHNLFYLVLVCFFLSGMSGLIYEILWNRMIVKIIGSAPFSMSIILTVFMGGLGFGSYLAGRYIDRMKAPLDLLRLYGGLELVIGIYAVLIPLIMMGVHPLQTILYNNLYNFFIIYNILTFIICAIILCIPVICMGATLPVLSRFYISRMDHLGTHAGRLYGLNTIGGALGSLICGFWLIHLWGVSGTLFFAVGINILIGLSCITVSYKARGSYSAGNRTIVTEEKKTSEIIQSDPLLTPTFQGKAALMIFFVSGFCAMAIEVIWARLLGLIVGPTTYSFTIVLVTFISGLALGSMIFGYLADRIKNTLRLLIYTQIAAALLVLFISQLLGNSQLFFAKLIYTFKDDFGSLNMAKAISLFIFMILPTLFFGAAFPLVGKIYTQTVEKIGRSIGFAYMVNTIGALCGPFFAGFIFIPLLGKESGIKIVVSLQLVASLSIMAYAVWKSNRTLKQWSWIIAPALVGLLSCFLYPTWNQRLLSVGKYQGFEAFKKEIDSTNWLTSLLFGQKILEHIEKAELIYYGEGIGGFTTVVKYTDAMGDITYTLANSGKRDASSRRDMQSQVLLCHFPMLWHENPKNVMVIGLGSGITAGEVLNYPVNKLDILEINDQVVEASHIFIPWNNNVLLDSRTNLIIQDARAHLQLTNQMYDVIISEPSNPWMAGLAALFTSDFFKSVKSRLNDEGVFAQWIHAYQMDWDTFSLIGRTFAQTFPNNLLVNMTPSRQDGDYLLVGCKGKTKLNIQDGQQKLTFFHNSTNLMLNDPSLLYWQVISDELYELFGPGVVNTDNHPRLEFAAPKLMYHIDMQIAENLQERRLRALSENMKNRIRQNRADIDSQIDFAAYAFSVYNPLIDIVDISQATSSQKERFWRIFDDYCANNFMDYASLRDNELQQRCASIQANVLEEKISRLPNQMEAFIYLAYLYNFIGRPEDAIHSYQEVLKINPRSATTHTNLGVAFAQQGRIEEAIKHFTEALKLDSRNPNAYYNLGVIMIKATRLDEAIRCFQEALKMNPEFAEAHHQIGLAMADKGDMSEATLQFKEAIRINPKFTLAYKDLGINLAMQDRMDEAIQVFSLAVEIDPEDAELHNNLCIALARQGKLDDAITHFRAAVIIRPDFEEARDNLNRTKALQQGQRY